MTTKTYFSTILLTPFGNQLLQRKIALVLFFTLVVSGCSSTTKEAAVPISKISLHDMATVNACSDHAKNIATHAELVASKAQYLAAANAVSRCIKRALLLPNYHDSRMTQGPLMKMMAVATLNFIKAGDVLKATKELDRFRKIYPNQDLYFEDYTSFLDTTTALLSPIRSGTLPMSTLNISRVLRDEIERKHYWLNH